MVVGIIWRASTKEVRGAREAMGFQWRAALAPEGISSLVQVKLAGMPQVGS